MDWRVASSDQWVTVSPDNGILKVGESTILTMQVDNNGPAQEAGSENSDGLCCDVAIEVILIEEPWTPPDSAGEDERPTDPLTQTVIRLLPGGAPDAAYDTSRNFPIITLIGLALTLFAIGIQLFLGR